MKKKFVSTILIISILSTGLLSGCGKSASAESVVALAISSPGCAVSLVLISPATSSAKTGQAVQSRTQNSARIAHSFFMVSPTCNKFDNADNSHDNHCRCYRENSLTRDEGEQTTDE